MSKLCSKYFSSSGSWTAPAGVTQVWVLAQGGGGGGDGGRNTTFGTSAGGYGTIPVFLQTAVTPNTSYTITIGAGGTGGAPRVSGTSNGGAGGDTTFGSLLTFSGANGATSTVPTAKLGLVYGSCNAVGTAAVYSTSGFVRQKGTMGTSSGSYNGGRYGAPGYYGSVGGTGGNGNNAGTGTNGSNGTGFGAGGGGGGSGSTAGGSGGNGSGGQLWVIWIE